jgi:hypothetical protein
VERGGVVRGQDRVQAGAGAAERDPARGVVQLAVLDQRWLAVSKRWKVMSRPIAIVILMVAFFVTIAFAADGEPPFKRMEGWVQGYESNPATLDGQLAKLMAYNYAVGIERGVVGLGFFLCASPYSYETFTSMMRDEYRREPKRQDATEFYALVVLQRLGCKLNTKWPQ